MCVRLGVADPWSRKAVEYLGFEAWSLCNSVFRRLGFCLLVLPAEKARVKLCDDRSGIPGSPSACAR